jgi:hypothetical protein
MPFHFAQLVGHYRLVVSPELLEFVERTFVEPAPPGEQAAIRAEALAEAAAAQLVIEPDGTLISRTDAAELYRILLEIPQNLVEELSFEKAPGHVVTLRLLDANRLLAEQPGKPNAVFERAQREP